MGFGALDADTTATAVVSSFVLVYGLSFNVWAAAAASVVCIASAAPFGDERKNNPIYKLAGLGVISAYLAHSSETVVASHLFFIGICLRAQPPKSRSELVLNGLLQASWIVWHASLLAIPTAILCTLGAISCPDPLTFLRWVGPTIHASTLLTLPSATTGGPEHWSTKYVIPILWDPPLLCCLWICHYFGNRFARDGSGTPAFLSVIDERICVSSLPFASDVEEMQLAKVKSVVNMCREYQGPEDAYAKADIVQGRFPTFDTMCPTDKCIAEAVEFIKVCLVCHCFLFLIESSFA
jgi:hypothetical protein